MADSSNPAASQPRSSALPGRAAGAAESNPQNASTTAASSSAAAADVKPKKKKHRGGRKRRNRRQSFAPTEATEGTADGEEYRPALVEASRVNAAQQASFYQLQAHGHHSNTSLESEALLDHRDRGPVRSRRDTFKNGLARVAMPFHRHRPSDSANQSPGGPPRSRLATDQELAPEDEDYGNDAANDRTPLLAARSRSKPQLSRNNSGLGHYGSHAGSNSNRGGRRGSDASKASSRRRFLVSTTAHNTIEEPHDVNNPPSVPGSPTLGSLDDMFMSGAPSDRGRDAVVDFAGADLDSRYSVSPEGRRRRPTFAGLAERDVCFPVDEERSDHAVDDEYHETNRSSSRRRRRRRTRVWPDLEVLEEWSREEKEERTQQDLQRAKKISEPVMIGGRLRPAKTTEWHREEDDEPFRFTYFNETLDGTIHARSISDLQDDITFKELFLPEPVELSDDSDDEEIEPEERTASERPPLRGPRSSNDSSAKHPAESLQKSPTPRDMSQARTGSIVSKFIMDSAPGSGNETPKAPRKRYGERPTFWLDVLKPTEMEMKVLSKAFGIHQLTSEDILMNEPREKVELFPSYYFVNYRTFEQDTNSEEYMEGINMYVIVFKSGVITFHHSMSPHPANVRRRIRQLNDYMSPTADWISYAMIDDITDVYLPRVTHIEGEVDEIDEDILYMHSTAADKVAESSQKKDPRPKSSKATKSRQDSDPTSNTQADMGAVKGEGDNTVGESGGATLRRIGVCRKKVMQLYRLLGNKADVIKGFAKRCNEHHDIAPRSDIGLYLGDIQDHIVTMNSSLSHFESLLSRAHANYMAQISIRMNERAEQNADVLGKLTVLGTIVLPMNIITGMWGMNVWVPGQEYEGDLTWFFCITAGLIAFGLSCYFIAKRVYGIV